MNNKKKKTYLIRVLAALSLSAVLCLSASAGIMEDMTDAGESVVDNITDMTGMSGKSGSSMGKSGKSCPADDPDTSTLGDLDGDGVIENENGAKTGLRDEGMGFMSDDNVLDTTGNSSMSGSTTGDGSMSGNTTGDSSMSGRSANGTANADGTMPISEGTSNGADMSESGSAMSWTAVIIAILLAAALVAVIIALIPKKEK